jgi:alpha-tubulin suppressor-like RCC1 family protein
LSGKTIKSIAAGDTSFYVIASDDKIYSWGWNLYGQLGNNSTTSSGVPVAVDATGALSGKTIKAVGVGGNAKHSCVIASDDQAYCWGYNYYRQLGNNSTTSQFNTPQAVVSTGALSGKTVKFISIGYQNSCVIASDNNAYCWGANTKGQIGDGGTSISAVPVAVSTSGALSGLTMTSINNGSFHTCATASDDKVYCWGYNNYGQLGNNSTSDSLTPIASTPLLY